MIPEQRSGKPDFQLFVLSLLLIGFGLIMVFSSSHSTALMSKTFHCDALYFTKRQLCFAFLGLICMFFVMNVHYTTFKRWMIPLFLMTLFLLVFVLFQGKLNGAKSWIRFGPVGLQPSEVGKLSTILYLATLITKKGERFRDFRKGYLPAITVVGFVAGLIMLQPDLGACIILVAACTLVIYCGGASMKHILTSFLLFVIGVTLSIGVSYLISLVIGDHTQSTTSNYKVGRIKAFVDPFADASGYGFNVIRSLASIGDGGWFGTGIGQGTLKLHYLPNAYTDFIFSVIGQELGFIGTALFLLVYLYFILRGITVSLRCPDPFGTLVGMGIMGLIAIQAFINIGGVTNTIPLTGVTLPLISYGGSSLAVTMIGIGIVLSISKTNPK